MVNSLIKWFAKKYLLSIVNDALKKMNDNEKVQTYKSKISQSIKILSDIDNALEDNKLSEEEVQSILNKVDELI